jgi:hypothetical protein
MDAPGRGAPILCEIYVELAGSLDAMTKFGDLYENRVTKEWVVVLGPHGSVEPDPGVLALAGISPRP